MTTKINSKLALLGGHQIRGEKKFPVWPKYTNRESHALLRTLKSGNWGIGGSEVERFEKTFSEYQQSKYCVAMTNGSVSLRNALIACGLQEGAEVIVPPYTFLATATAVIEANCVPVFADIDPDTFCIDPQKIEELITPNTKAIIPVHLGGHPAEMDSIMAIAKKHGLYVIEDSAHAHGSEYKGRRVGSLGYTTPIYKQPFMLKNNFGPFAGWKHTNPSLNYAETKCPVAEKASEEKGCWLLHHILLGNQRDMKDIVDAVSKIHENKQQLLSFRH